MLVKFLDKMSTIGGEDNLEEGDGTQAQTPEQIQTEIDTIMATSAYTSKGEVGHSVAVQKVSQLFERLTAVAA